MGEYQLIEDAFYRSYDPSVLEHLLADENRLGRLEKVGEGFCFRAYRLSGTQMPIVLHIAKREFFREKRDDIKEWRSAMDVVRKLRAPLIPPMELLILEDKVAYAMPFCPKTVPESSLTDQVRDFYQALDSHKLDLGDCLQVRGLGNLAFQIDWSDLGFSSAKNGRFR
ncbi:MAG: hypothetical protein AB7T49_06580 [Oligoflexales bacterium]